MDHDHRMYLNQSKRGMEKTRDTFLGENIIIQTAPPSNLNTDVRNNTGCETPLLDAFFTQKRGGKSLPVSEPYLTTSLMGPLQSEAYLASKAGFIFHQALQAYLRCFRWDSNLMMDCGNTLGLPSLQLLISLSPLPFP